MNYVLNASLVNADFSLNENYTNASKDLFTADDHNMI